MTSKSYPKQPENATGVIVFDDGTVIWGRGFGAEIQSVGEICFNTGLTGYQETLTDPSFAAQIITFTFPHIGNVGVNDEDMEAETQIIAEKLAAGPPISLKLIRQSAWAALDSDFPEQLKREREFQLTAGRTQDFAEGVTAFREKRKPKFTGK